MSKELNLFATDKKVPSFLSDAGAHSGSDGVSADDIAIPQLKILQPLSPELMMGIPDAKAGMFLNSVTHELFDKLYVINLQYEHNYAIFKTREAGGGKAGQANTIQEAHDQIELMGGNAADYQISDTGVHRMLGLTATGAPSSPLVMYFSSTRKRVSQQWNTQLQLRCEEFSVPRYASVWELSITQESNNKGAWFGMKVDFAGLIQDQALFEKAKQMRDTMEQVPEWVPQIAQQSS